MGEKIFIDTNIFLELFLDGEKADECEQFLKSLKNKNEEPITTDFVVYSWFIIVERRLKSGNALKTLHLFFSNFTSLNILRLDFNEIYNGINIIDEYNLDFDDSLVVACMRTYGIEKLASLDRHFDKVKDIKRISLF